LKGEYIGWIYELNKMPLTKAMRVLKNYTDSGNLLDYFNIEKLNPELIKRYLRFIFAKNPKSYWCDSLIDDNIVNGRSSRYVVKLIDSYNAYYWVNYISKSNRSSMLIALLENFSRELDWDLTTEEENAKKEEYLNKLMSYMQRNLTPWEKEFIDEDYYRTDN
jgi:hypothetical protein